MLFFALKNLKEIDNLGLTTEQKEKVAELHQAKFEQIETVLTPEQRQAFKQIEIQRSSRYQSNDNVNLSADQKAELATIRQATMHQFRAFLTPSQQVQLEQINDWEKGIAIEPTAKLNLTSEQKEKMKQLWAADLEQRCVRVRA